MKVAIGVLALGAVAIAWSGRALAQPKPASATAELNGIRMYYEVHGQGARPLVFLHGFGESAQAWSRFVPEFAKGYRVIVPDLRGHGHSTNPSGEFTVRQSAKDVYALLDRLGIERFRAIGVSAGGATLLHMATSQRTRPEAMVLIGTPTYFAEQARAIMRNYLFENLSTEDLERRRRIHRYGDEQIKALLRQFNGFAESYDDVNFTPPHLATIRARTLIVNGDRDEFIPVSMALEMYRSIPNASLWIVPTGRHVPIYAHADEFIRIALEFLDAQTGK